ncbi:MAG: orotidine-5'-phosphate decarboxylase [Anaerolineales bacterium]|nr:MAG: orotidine-5'-phosphate decarboxylase [Anaerolineales bacterium]
MTTFIEKLRLAQSKNESWLCVGLDPVMARLPEAVRGADSPLVTFARAIVEATADVVSAFKPNLAFWLAEGPAGLSALLEVVALVPDDVPVILDAKSNDVGHTAAAYAKTAFEVVGADAVTVNPYLGIDALRPFLSGEDRAVFLLARTSNPSAPDLQDLSVDGRPLYESVTELAVGWDEELQGCCGLVVGATYPEELARLRQLAPNLPFLIPGIGAQGGSLEPAVVNGPTASGIGPVINSSRGIIFASAEADFAAAARSAAITLRDRINEAREASQ